MVISVVTILEEGLMNTARSKPFKTEKEAKAFMDEELAVWISTRSNLTVDTFPNLISAHNDKEIITLSLNFHEI